MNIIFLCLMMLSPYKEATHSVGPQFFYFDGKRVSELRTIRLPNLGTADIVLFVKSPVELIGAAIDSSEIPMCIPTFSEKDSLGLSGRTGKKMARWYRLTFSTRLRVGVTRHTLRVESAGRRTYSRGFRIEVEGAMKLERPFKSK